MSADLPEGEKGFTCEGYFDAEMENITIAREIFHKTEVAMFANFWPCEWNDKRHSMSRAFAYAAAHDVGHGRAGHLSLQPCPDDELVSVS